MKKNVSIIQMLAALIAVAVVFGLALIPPAAFGEPENDGKVVDLALLPKSQTVQAGNDLVVTIEAQCNGQEVSGIAAYLNFDPNYLEVKSIEGGTTLTSELYNTFDNVAGTADYAAGKLGGPFPSDTFTVATITFRAKAVSDSIVVGFNDRLVRLTDADMGGQTQLRSAIGTSVTVKCVDADHDGICDDQETRPDQDQTNKDQSGIGNDGNSGGIEPPTSIFVGVGMGGLLVLGFSGYRWWRKHSLVHQGR